MEPGTRLAHFEILALLGRGGMGEVWRARDTRLDREVALKILPRAFAEEPERLARFQREAKVLAALNHPGIAAIYGLESDAGRTALAMELALGQTLAARLAQGALPLDEALEVATRIAAGLEAAHDAGIVHRDLKPANVMLAPDGTVKILDFGLARALQGETDVADDPSNSPTLTAAMTGEGVILGTAAYMSPEQARGRPVDRRADLWAFGVILWEMLTGRRLFEGETTSDIMAGVLRADIDLDGLPARTPRALRRLLRRCLERDPKKRLRDAGDAAIELEEATDAAAAPEPADLQAGTASRGPGRAVWGATLAVALVATAVAVWALLRPGDEAAPTRAPVAFERRTFDQEVIFNAAFLPNEQGIVYSSARSGNSPELVLLPAGAMAPRKLAGAGTMLLSVASDGELAVLTGAIHSDHRVFYGTLARMSIDGAPRPLVDEVRDADWGPDGALAIARRVEGTDRLEYPLGTVIYTTTGYVSEPRVSPDGSRVAFLDHQWLGDDRGWLKVCDRAGGVETVSREFWAIEGLAWLPDGRSLAFSGSVAGGDLQPYVVQPGSGAARPILAVPGEFTVLDVDAEGRWLALEEESRAGVVAHPQGGPDIDLSWLDSSWNACLSPDGLTLAFCNGHGSANYQIVTRRLDGSPITVLGEGDLYGFSPDGNWVAARLADPPGAVIYPVGAGEPRRLEGGPLEQFHAVQWYPDSENVLISGNEPGQALRAYRQSIAGGPPVPVTPEGVDGRLSPDGKAILEVGEGGAWRLHPLDGGDPRPVAGVRPHDRFAAWSPDSDAFFVYRTTDVPARVDRVDLATGARSAALTIDPEVRAGLTRIIFDQRTWDRGHGYAYWYERKSSKLLVVTGVGD